MLTDEQKDAQLAKSPSDDKLTPERIDATIKTVKFHRTDGTGTVAIVTLQNGYEVLGYSACVDPANYRQDLGEKIALDDAKKKIWPLEGYLLKQKLWERARRGSGSKT